MAMGNDQDRRRLRLQSRAARYDARESRISKNAHTRSASGTYLDTKENREKKMQGHVMLEVELSEKNRTIRVMLDPSCQDCDVDEIPETRETVSPEPLPNTHNPLVLMDLQRTAAFDTERPGVGWIGEAAIWADPWNWPSCTHSAHTKNGQRNKCCNRRN